MLSYLNCRECKSRNICFLQKVQLQRFPEQVQRFVITLPQNAFAYQAQERLWYADRRIIQEQLVSYYDTYHCELKENIQPFLTYAAQRESDRQFIRKLFKQMLDIAAKENEDKNPELSIMFYGIGLILASDYVEAVNKIFSMFQTVIKNDDLSSGRCFGYQGYHFP